jgi:heme exporter protein D
MMAFDSFSEFIAMGGYSEYVWSAYGFSFFILLFLLIQSLRLRSKVAKRISMQLKRESKLKERRQVVS